MSEIFSNDDALARRLQQLADSTAGSTTSWRPAGGRSVDGHVVLDSRDGGMEAVRSTASLTHRQLVVQAGPLVIALDVSGSDATHDRYRELALDRPLDIVAGTDTDASAPPLMVRGQILAGLSGTAVVQFVSPEGAEGALATVDELGEFEVQVTPGEWMIFVADDEIDAASSVTLG